MIYIKTEKEIEAIRMGSKILAQILKELRALVKPGISTASLEEYLVKAIKDAGGRPAFKDYPLGPNLFFPTALCASINEEVVHGPALPGRILKSGDIIDLDIGMEWPVKEELRKKYDLPLNVHSKFGGFFSDTCYTVGVGKISKEAKNLLKVSKKSLDLVVQGLKPGVTLNEIGGIIEDYVSKYNYGIVRDLVGHGIGYYAHEAPEVFHYRVADELGGNIELKAGMIICIEPMVNLGTWRIKLDKNKFSYYSADRSLSAHYEHTILITKDSYELLTAL